MNSGPDTSISQFAFRYVRYAWAFLAAILLQGSGIAARLITLLPKSISELLAESETVKVLTWVVIIVGLIWAAYMTWRDAVRQKNTDIPKATSADNLVVSKLVLASLLQDLHTAKQSLESYKNAKATKADRNFLDGLHNEHLEPLEKKFSTHFDIPIPGSESPPG